MSPPPSRLLAAHPPLRLYLGGRRERRPSSSEGQSGLSTARSMSLSVRMRSPSLGAGQGVRGGVGWDLVGCGVQVCVCGWVGRDFVGLCHRRLMLPSA